MFLLVVFTSFHFNCMSFHFDDPRSDTYNPMSVKRILNTKGTAFTWLLFTREQLYFIPPVPSSTSACRDAKQPGLTYPNFQAEIPEICGRLCVCLSFLSLSLSLSLSLCLSLSVSLALSLSLSVYIYIHIYIYTYIYIYIYIYTYIYIHIYIYISLSLSKKLPTPNSKSASSDAPNSKTRLLISQKETTPDQLISSNQRN